MSDTSQDIIFVVMSLTQMFNSIDPTEHVYAAIWAKKWSDMPRTHTEQLKLQMETFNIQ